MKRVLYACLLALYVQLCTVSVRAETAAWGPREQILEAFGKDFREQPIGIGLSRNGVILTLLASPRFHTWTLLITHPNGMTCAVDAGESWQPTEWLDYPTFGDGI